MHGDKRGEKEERKGTVFGVVVGGGGVRKIRGMLELAAVANQECKTWKRKKPKEMDFIELRGGKGGIVAGIGE